MEKMPGKRKDRGELQVGDVVLGRYLLEERLGSGAMGVVFKCLERVSGVEYALKLVPPELAHNADLMEDVRENFRLVHGLKHPNIASMDFLERDEYGSYFLIMEYVQGENLTRWIRRKWSGGQPDAAEIIHVVKQIAAALDYAHQKQILHRDVKPANVMADEEGNIKVLDFGLASKVRSSMTALSLNPANTNGTPAYLSPEQFKARYPGPAADQYALGVMTYQMFAGYLPFAADDFAVLRAAVIGEEPDRPDGLPDPVWAALQRALSKNPKERFETCTAFAAAVEKGFASAVSGWERGCQYGDLDPESLYHKVKECYVRKDYEQAVKYFRQAAEQGYARAQFNLGVCYENGQGVEKNIDEAVKWYRKAADQGDADAQLNLGVCYDYGQGVEKNIDEAVKWYRRAADQGNASAQFNLGVCYENGRGVEQDDAEAFKWYWRAAEQGYDKAQYSLGQCYYFCRGVEKDYGEAVKWYRRAADQGNARAQGRLGVCYYFGQGVAKDYDEAVKWFWRAAEQGDAQAQCNLGYYYEFGDGVEKDYREAVKWFRRAAEQGHDEAQVNLGVCYEYGKGVEKNIDEAVKWYRRAADQGNASAQFNLGECYEYGQGVEKNLDEAVKWYRQAAEQGDEAAKEALERLEK